MESRTKEEYLKRFNFIEGHLAGVKRMVNEEKYCVDILKQTYAVRRAIEKLEAMMLEGHLNSCVVSGIKDGREKEMVQELLELYTLSAAKERQ